MLIAYIQVIVPVDSRYPWKPTQPPLEEKLTQVVSDALRHLEGVGPVMPATTTVTVTIRKERGR